jgi:predicted amidophosphoribosyltransferase
MIARGMAECMDLHIDSELLISSRKKESQTSKTRFDRWLNTSSAFELMDSDKYVNKHLLLVDDVITTGSTTLRCLEELRQIEGVQLSVFSLAFADRL